MSGASAQIHDARVRSLGGRPARGGRFVLYWMQQSQRASSNHALEYAVQRANALGLPVRVGFGLTDDYPEATWRHLHFMLEGLVETAAALAARGIPLVLRHGSPPAVALALADGAAELVCDRGYLRHQRRWREEVAAAAPCPVTQVESDVVVPSAAASTRAEIGARTLRPRIARRLDEFLVPLKPTPLVVRGGVAAAGGVALDDVELALRGLRVDRSVAPVSSWFRGGTSEASRRLAAFARDTLPRYASERSQPEGDAVSHLSMYLHFGQVSPIDVALAVRDAGAGLGQLEESAAKFVEELVVRRELGINFVTTTEAYDTWGAVPAWARATLSRHAADPRPAVYSRDQLAEAATADPYFNAAMREMRFTGYLHNQMRMYWGKKILEWTADPETAHATALALNNRYLLDGRDPSSFANVGWIFGLHDRPWPERPIFGTVRTMTARGLERKSDIAAYVDAVNRRVADASGAASP
ncbi:MAG TPA: deoxyribodipyrimidine photo-lyase [Polyangia bacterium]|nr:deoxyribodipyrimidine photo-lyase [Polyangia bacterium]